MATRNRITARRTAGPAASTHDAIVVGARVAGAATAMLLARQGLRVLLLERAPTPGTDTVSTHALMRVGVAQLHRWGLLDAVRTAGTPPVRRTVFHYGDDVETIEISNREGVDALYAPRRTVLDRLLVEAAAASGADVRFGVAVERLVWNGDRVAGIEGRTRAGSLLATAPLVIGADGMMSTVARSVAAPVVWQGRHSSAFLYGHFSDVEVTGYEWLYRPRVAGGIIPTNDGQVCAWVGAPTERLLPALRTDLEGAFAAVLGEVSPAAAIRVAAGRRHGRLRGFPGVPGYLRRAWGPGWALVGDAGAYRDALSAHGMTDALRDAELLANAAATALGGGDTAAFAAYERRRDAAALDVARITDAVAAYRWSLPELRALLLDLARAMSRGMQVAGESEPTATAA